MKTISHIFQFGSGNCSARRINKLSDFMRKDLSAIGFGLVLSGLVVLSSFAADPATVALHGHVPLAVANGNAKLIDHMAADTTINFSIGLPLRNQNELERTIRQVSDPANPNYGHYLTPQQFTERFGPTRQDYEAVKAFAKKSGFTITTEHPNRVLLSLSGRAADIEKAFHVNLNRYQHPTEAREFFAPDREPTIDPSLHVLHVEGLDNYYLPQSNLRKLNQRQTVKPMANKPAGAAPAGVNPAVGTGPGGSYQGSDFRNAYIPGSSLTGTGQNVGLLQFDGFFTNDIAAYAAGIGLNNGPSIVVVPVDGGVSAPGFGSSEVSLDIEMVLSMSPGVSNIYVYEAPNPSPFPDLLNRMANDNLAKQLSCSWFVPFGPPEPVSEQIFQQMAVQGQSFFTASGDADAYPSGQLIPFPSDSPHITTVGGTTLTMNGAGQSYSSEAVWNWGIEFGFDGAGSSGGVSTSYSIPTWQTNINSILSGGSSTMRNVPDVAMTGDNVWVIFGGGQSGAFGGTSCAAPLWAGFTALVNQQAAAVGHPPVGFLNPALYSLAANPYSLYTKDFHDVTNLNNTWSQSPNAFFAVSNYDNCTGLGTPNGTNLINDLLIAPVVPVHISPPPPPYGTTMGAVSGGNPNGTWSVFIQDDAPINSGYVSNGWVLSLTLADIVGTAADLETYMTASSSAALLGQPVTFFLAVTNYGPSTSTNVQVIDTLPTGVTVVGTNATLGTVSRLGATVIWNVGALVPNTGAGLALTVQFSGLGNFVNTAQCQAATPDPNPDDDLASTNISVVTPNVTLVPGFASSSNTFQINVPGPTNPTVSVVIQSSTNLVSSNWINVYTGTPPFIFNYPAGGNVNRFFRAQVSP